MDQYFIEDARKINKLGINGKADLIITSPPYFDMKDYGSKNQIGFGQTYEAYLKDIELVFQECFKVSKDTGSLWIIVDILKKDGKTILLPFDIAKKVEDSGWHLRDVIIWQKDKTVPYTHNGEMRNIFEYILYFTKTDKYKFYRERITSIHDLKDWWQRYPERYSPNGKSPTNIWDFPIPLQGSWGKRYIKHFCPLPESLIERIIHLSSDKNDTIFDPFAGSGAVLSAAYRLKRHYLGCDLNRSYKQMFQNYVKNVKPINVDDLYINNNIKNFSQVIEKLRLLKFPKKLYQEYIREFGDGNNNALCIFAIPTKDKNLPKNKFLSCKYLFVVEDTQHFSIDKLKSLTEKKPLSKYGIASEIVTIKASEIRKVIPMNNISSYWKYENGITYKSGSFIKSSEIRELVAKKQVKFPPIVSPIDIRMKDLEINI